MNSPNSNKSNKLMHGLPEEVKFCRRCVVSNQRPSSTVEFKNDSLKKETIEFDKDGVCSACAYHDLKYKEINWDQRENELLTLLEKYRSPNREFDVIVPGSGGKDSFYISHILKNKYGMTPLTVTWPPHMYTDIGRKNFDAWLQSGFSNITYSPNQDFHRKLTKAAFENLCHPFQPFILGQKQVGVKIAKAMGIDLVFYGESQAEGGTNIREGMQPMMLPKYFTAPSNEIKRLPLGGVTVEEWLQQGFTLADLDPYIPTDADQFRSAGIEVHYLGYYHCWRPQDHYYYAVENGNFNPNPERTEGTYSKYASLDDKIDGFHYYTTYIKFGIGRATYDAAQEIRNGHLTREEGVRLVHKYDGEFPKRYMAEFLEYCDLTMDKFNRIIDENRSPNLWEKADQEHSRWELKHKVW
ncbi:MAG: LPS biosynthesis protein PseA [Acidiferrobacteraceae bacterium]|nr:LPS biosynthesis protein PseA [Acidiferrobacteraceae bacterium]|tara:strand:- start:483 stop:1715 length:1233 start_codon:yes stop_codon:yes gene_type:complete